MARQTRMVDSAEAGRILAATGSVLRKKGAGRNVYWSSKLNSWVTITKKNGMFEVSWDGTADCGC